MLKYFFDYFFKFEKDKLLHFIAGILIYMAASLVLNCWYSLGIVIVMAYLKEVYDSTVTKFDSKDLIYTVIGGLVTFFYHLCLIYKMGR